MRRRLRRVLSSASLVACAASSATAGAEGAPVRVRLDYRASEGCPDAAAFQGAVTSRAPEVRFDDEERPGLVRRWTVSVASAGASARGELSTDGGVTVRAIEGESCASVVTALSVVAAFSVVAARRTSDAADEAPAISPPALAAQQPAPEAPVQPAAAAAPRWRPAFGIAWLVQSSRAAFGPSLFVGLERSTTATTLAPALRLHGARIIDGRSGRAFGWWLVGLEGCALRFGLGSAVAAHLPCLDVEGGSLASSGFVSDRARPWLATGASARIAVSVGRAWRLEVTGAGLVPLYRDTFRASPDQAAYRTDVIVVRLAAGVTLALP